MKAPHKVLKEIEKSIFKPEYTFEHIKDLAGETLTHVFHLKTRVDTSGRLPAIIFVTETKKVFIYSLRIDTEMQEEMDLLDIDAITKAYISEHRLKYMLLNKELQFEGYLTEEKLPFVNHEAIKEYRDYVENKLKEEREKYTKEQEYRTYLKLKEKFEGDTPEKEIKSKKEFIHTLHNGDGLTKNI
ncbi:hypothetical protein [Staphylococcus delphini]|uniref:hypothetical protein n=1 Tax=Staphylococcus delphini TaxID=53344 RepID=UPI000F70A5E7|nr:hypothetical protein [Staphylococcus delphini]VED62486.1 phage protein [Staphylococcus delphini]